MMNRMAERSRRGQSGFTLIELLVVIIILGILAAVVVFSVSGINDTGQSAANAIDARTVRTAMEAHRAQNGSYVTEADLVAAGLLNEESVTHDVVILGDPGSPDASYFLTCDNNPDTGTCDSSSIAEGVVPRGGTLRVPGTTNPANVTGNNFVNPAVTSSGTSHPNVEYMFNGLMRWAENNTPQPDLAQSYVISPDQTTATFTLRPGMVWHDGSPILNSDVKFTMEKALFKYHSRTGPSMVPALGGTGGGTTAASVPGGAITLPAAGVVQFNFVYGYAPLLRQMNVTEAPIIPQSVYGPCDDTGTNNINTSGCAANNPTSNVDFPANSPVGSGPFRFKSRNSTTAALVFVNRNTPGGVGATPYHLTGLPLADELLQVPTSNSSDGLIAGTIDVGGAGNDRILPIVPPQTSADITPAAGFTIAEVPRGSGGGNCITTFPFHLWNYGTTTNAIGALPADSPYTHEFFGDQTPVDPDGAGPLGPMPRGTVVRRAISMGIDRQASFLSRDFGKGRLADSPYHSKLPPYQPQPSFPTFTPSTAATYLDNAGWTVSGAPAIRRSTGAPGMPPAGTPLAWAVRRVTGGQDNLYQDMKVSLAAAPVSIDIAAGSGNHAEVPADASTNTTGALVAGNRNFDMLVVSYCAGDDPVIGVRRQFHSDGLPAAGAPSNFTNPAGVRSTVMDGYWNNAFGAGYTSNHQSIQQLAASDAYQILFSEGNSSRAWKTSRCSGFNNFNTGLFVETGSCI